MITDPKMLDIAILELNAAMLANISWLSNVYGKIEHLKEVEEGTEKTYPAVYIGKNEYLKLFPDDELGSFSYIDIRDTNDVSEMQRISLETVTELSIVFWFDYRQVSPSDADGTTIENVKYELAQFILRYGFQTFSFEIQSFSEQVDNVYNGLSHEVIKNQFNMRPYGCLKITGQLRHRQRCGNVTNPIVTLPVSPIISSSSVKELYEANDNTNAFTDAEKAKLDTLENVNLNQSITIGGNLTTQGYHTFSQSFSPFGGGVPNSSIFKGTDGHIYYKSQFGSVSKLN